MHFPPSPPHHPTSPPPPIPTVSPLTLLSLQPLLCVSQWILHGAAGGWWLPSLARSLVAESSHSSSEGKRNEQYTHSPFSYHCSLHVLVKLHMPSHITHTHTPLASFTFTVDIVVPKKVVSIVTSHFFSRCHISEHLHTSCVLPSRNKLNRERTQ